MRLICWFLIVFCGFVFGGCDMLTDPGKGEQQSIEQTVTKEGKTVKPSDPEIARVNGQSVRKSELLDYLYKSYGKQSLKELMDLQAVRIYAGEHDVKPDQTNIDKEMQLLLDDMAPGKSRQDQEALLKFMLKSRGLTRPQMDLILQRQSLLRQLVDPNVIVTEAMIEDAYESRYGKRLSIWQLSSSNLRKMEQAKQELAEGKDFSKLIRELSEDEASLATGGLVGPFSRADSSIDSKIRQTAFALQAIGNRSEVVSTLDDSGQPWWHIIQLESVIEAQDIELNTVRESLMQTIKGQIVKQRMAELHQKIKIDTETFILDPKLR